MTLFRAVPATLVALALVMLSAVAAADPMTPLPSEYLAQPVTLRCGLVIREWRGGSQPNPAGIAEMNRLCDEALTHFRPFIAGHDLRAPFDGAFEWSESLIPDGYCARCLNDKPGRFANRFVPGDLWGYSSLGKQYSFLISDMQLPIFPQVFVHELFHAMSMYFGLFASHPGNTWQKVDADEALARAFTKSMGLGE